MQVGNAKEAKALLNKQQRGQQQQRESPEDDLDSLLAMTLHWMGTRSYQPVIVLEILQDFLLAISFNNNNNTDKFVYRQLSNPSN